MALDTSLDKRSKVKVTWVTKIVTVTNEWPIPLPYAAAAGVIL